MYLRRNRSPKGDYEYWTLVRSVRTTQGPRQEIVATLGKLPGLDPKVRAGWEDIADLLDGVPPSRQLRLGENDAEFQPLWKEVDVRGVRVERAREFGSVYVALSLWRRLHLHTLLEELLPEGKEQVGWETVACILSVARFCAQPSELGVAERWYQRTALEDLLGVGWEKINDDRLYRGLDMMLQQKDRITTHLLKRYQSWFGVRFEFLVYDVTSTYFEGQGGGRSDNSQSGYVRPATAFGGSNGGKKRFNRVQLVEVTPHSYTAPFTHPTATNASLSACTRLRHSLRSGYGGQANAESARTSSASSSALSRSA